MVLASFASGDTTNQTARIPTWTPCSTDPVSFDCQNCEIGWSNCKLRLDDSLRHWRAAQYSRHSGFFSANEERDNEIERKIVCLLLSHGISVNVNLLLQYIPKETLNDITVIELENLLRKSPKFVESSPRMFRLKDLLQEDGKAPSFKPLSISSGTQLESLIENSPTLGSPRQIRLFKEYSGLKLLASFGAKQSARIALDEIIQDCLETVLFKRAWTIQTANKYAVSSDTVPKNGVLTEYDVAATSRLLSAVSASELLTRMSPARAFKLVPALKETLVRGNLRLVANEARIRANGGFLTFADLFQIGTIGLMTAIERFDPFRGNQFSTYATYWIRQIIGREQGNLNRCIRLPIHVIEELNSLLQRRQELEFDLNRVPTNVELAKKLNVGPDRVQFLLQIARSPESLDLLMKEGPDAAEKCSILYESADGWERNNLWERIVSDAVEKVLCSLSSREAQVIRLRFGIPDGYAQTLEQVGQQFGVTRERIRQIEAKALRKLRRPSNALQLRDLL